METSEHVGEVRGTFIRCSTEGEIREVFHDGLGLIKTSTPATALSQVVDEESRSKLNRFFHQTCEQKALFDWEMNAEVDGGLLSVRFAGVCAGNDVLVIAALSDQGLSQLVEEIAKINSEQSNIVRAALKEIALLRSESGVDSKLFDEITHLNNELVNLQRQLSKKNAELAQLNELKNRFLGIAAHDLRNPLGNLLILVDFIREEKERLSDEQREYVQQIESLSSFMLDMVEDLLDVSSIETGRIELLMERQDLVAIVERNVSLNRMLAEKKEIAIHLDRQIPAASLYLDQGKIEQVINNLLTNAIKYSVPQTEITVRMLESDGEVITEVIDQGQGIAADELELLFRPFQKTSTRSTSGEKSVGLGLYIVKRIVEAHNGRIWAESEPGEGSVFRFSLPVQP